MVNVLCIWWEEGGTWLLGKLGMEWKLFHLYSAQAVYDRDSC